MRKLGWLAVFGIVGLAIAFGIYLLQIGKTITLEQPVSVVIEDNAGTEGAMTALWDAGVLPSRWAFVGHLVLTNQRTQVKSGTYVFTGDVTLPVITAQITQRKESRDEVEITLLEGWTNEDMAEHLTSAELVEYDEFINIAETKHSQTILPDNEYPFLVGKPLSVGLNGFLFPDTYRFFIGETEINIVEKMLNNFGSKFDEQMRQDLEAQGRNVYDAVTLASIVEKEVRLPEEKAIVAGIFLKRMENGMRIESDATINYITKKNTTTPSGSDLNVESAYNTYRNDGLPPTPINNPGLDSLRAVVYPEDSEYWFFLTTPEGEVKYSQNYDQHLETRAQYYD